MSFSIILHLIFLISFGLCVSTHMDTQAHAYRDMWRLQFEDVVGKYPPLFFYLIQLNLELTDVASLSRQFVETAFLLCRS